MLLVQRSSWAQSRSLRVLAGWVMCALLGTSVLLAEDWRQWAGPSRDFQVDAPPLARSWADAEPRELFRYPLRGGHSAVSVADGRLFVLHGRQRQEWLTVLDESGELIWEREHAVSYGSNVRDFDGPHAAPLVLDRPSESSVIVVSIDAVVRRYQARDGELLWQRDLRAEEGVTLPQAGYAASPLLDGDGILLPGLGGPGPGLSRSEAEGLGAFRLAIEDGRTIWKAGAFPSSHASPVAIDTASGPLAVFHGMQQLVGVEPESGEVRWSFPLRRENQDNVSFTPLWDATHRTLLISNTWGEVGSQAIQLDVAGNSPRRRWTNGRLKIQHGNGLLWNGLFLGTDGASPGFFSALDVATGELLWKERMPKATLLGIRGQLVLALDADGRLHLAEPSREGPGLRSRIDVLDELSWTLPTLVGRTLYVRGESTLVALELPGR